MSEQCDALIKQIKEKRYKREICECLCFAKRKHIASKKNA